MTLRKDFSDRHIGPGPQEVEKMLQALGCSTLEQLMDETIPESIRLQRDLELPEALQEEEALDHLRELADQNELRRSYLGMGYYGCITPTVILRNILENPGWYTQYTPYQAEISQGRMEALLNFQTLCSDLTGLEVANSSMLDEATAAAEAMTLCQRVLRKNRSQTFFVSERCHPQTIALVQTRAAPLGIEVLVGDEAALDLEATPVFAALVQYPDTRGDLQHYEGLAQRLHDAGALLIVATDLLALTMLKPPGEWGADVAVGNSQRFGVPMGYGGPHAAFLATRLEYKRQLPGRIIGVSVDQSGAPALRLALQTREQHIRRDRATSNICTAQVLLAVVASMYAVYHGPEGLLNIAKRVHRQTSRLAQALEAAGHSLHSSSFFDTLTVRPAGGCEGPLERAAEHRINLRSIEGGLLSLSLDETVTEEDLADLCRIFGAEGRLPSEPAAEGIPEALRRETSFLDHPTFSRYQSETELLRYIHRLQSRDLSLTTSMIPLGSCTMKLNATTEMIPVTWPGFGQLHPFAPLDQAQGYGQLFENLERWLSELTGFAATSLQPNAGSQGEYAGLLVIRAWHQARGEAQRNICLIPTSAHGTNPASAVMAGMKVVPVRCDAQGDIDLADLRAKAEKHSDKLAALMITYPSTHGVFEVGVREACETIHEHGGQVYLDGANMNALVGLARPGDFGADVCHLNLHKTFCIPHGGGGPGMGPICVAAHLAPYLPGHPHLEAEEGACGAVSAAPWGSPSILPISYAYIAMMGAEGLKRASEVAILSANYIAHRLEGHYEVLYQGPQGRVAHECIIDTRPLKESAGISVEDIAKRLMDYGFHAPTMSWPVAGTLMIEPTESESLEELERFCDALILIRDEIRAIERGELDAEDNPLKNAPHTALRLAGDWDHPYSRMQAAWPAPWSLEHKFWPHVGRVDNAYGDRNLVCSCPTMEAYGEG